MLWLSLGMLESLWKGSSPKRLSHGSIEPLKWFSWKRTITKKSISGRLDAFSQSSFKWIQTLCQIHRIEGLSSPESIVIPCHQDQDTNNSGLLCSINWMISLRSSFAFSAFRQLRTPPLSLMKRLTSTWRPSKLWAGLSWVKNSPMQAKRPCDSWKGCLSLTLTSGITCKNA